MCLMILKAGKQKKLCPAKVLGLLEVVESIRWRCRASKPVRVPSYKAISVTMAIRVS